MENETLSWEITSEEKRRQVKKVILIAWIPLVGLVATSLFYFTNDFLSWALREGVSSATTKLLGAMAGVAICIWLFYVLNKFLPYKKREYELTNLGITISKGKKTKAFSWNEFEYFYPYRSYKPSKHSKESQREKLLEASEGHEGQIFYLKEKPKNFLAKFYKIFIVVRSEAENSNLVSKFLDQYLTKKQMKNSSDLGLVFYKFK